MQDSIIVYRSPYEKMMYEFWMENPQYIAYIGIAIIIACCAGVGWDKWKRHNRARGRFTR